MSSKKESASNQRVASFTSQAFADGEVKIGKILENFERTILPVGSQIGKYRILEEIDRGGMAVVYKALQLDLDRIVALKVLPANVTINRQFVERFLSEAHAVARLNHPNIVSIHEVAMENNIYYLAMDHIDGKNLYYYLHEEKPKLVEVLQIIVQLADALSYAHDQKIVHRDLKLNNVIMDHGKRPLLIDFGLAKALEDDDGVSTRTGEIMGSPAYMAPERLLGHEADLRSDICSLGIMLYEMLTFKNPYLDPRSIHQTTLNVLESRAVAPRKLIPWLPVEVECITMKALQYDPEDRYQTMTEFRNDIVHYQRGEQVSVNPPSLLSKIGHYIRRRWAPITIGATALFFLLVLAAFHLSQARKEQWRWRLIQTHTFENQEQLVDWSVLDPTASGAWPAWEINEGALVVQSSQPTAIRLERPFTRDLRFEFDVISPNKNFFDFGFFMCGDSPENGYTFTIHSKESGFSGISYPGSDFLHYTYNPLTFAVSDRYHVIIEKVDNSFTFKLNGVVVATITDYMLPLGKSHRKVGFFSSGGIYRIDNLQIFRRSVPLLAGPTIVADRFWEYGDHESAFNEYRELLLDFSDEKIVRDVSLNMADCLVRMGRNEEADSILHIPPLLTSRHEAVRSRRLFLEAENYRRWGKDACADSVYALLRTRYTANPVNRFIAIRELERADKLLRDGKTDSAETKIIRTVNNHGWLNYLAGQYHLRILKDAVEKKQVEKAVAVASRIFSRYKSRDEILSEARIYLGRLYLGNRTKYKGIDYLNQSIGVTQMAPITWQGWWTLAEVYEYDHNIADAVSIYEKIQRECSESIPITWMARIKIAEFERTRKGVNPRDSILSRVIFDQHPFAQPRLIASLYAGGMSKDEFATRWQTLYPKDETYLFYWARSDILQGEYAAAHNTLQTFLTTLAPKSWEYEKTSLLIRSLRSYRE